MHAVTTVETTAAPALRIEVIPSRASVFVVLRGELDLSTAPVVSEELAGLREVGFCRLVLDLRALDFMDSTGLSLVVGEHERGDFAMVPGTGQPRQVLEMTGLLNAVPHVHPRDAPML